MSRWTRIAYWSVLYGRVSDTLLTAAHKAVDVCVCWRVLDKLFARRLGDGYVP